MKQINLIDQDLNAEQIAKCYEVYDFTDDETIISANYNKDENQLYIQYEDATGVIATYEPNCSSEEDFNKLLYILTVDHKVSIDNNKILETINVLETIQEMFIQEHLKENPEDADFDYVECEKAEEIQNTIYILENILDKENNNYDR